MYQKLNLQYLTCILLLAATPLIAAPYSDNGDGTVTDRKTNLVWQRCSMGQSVDATCSGTAGFDTWQNALAYCNGLPLGSRAWRLPSLNELKSIVDRSRASAPAIDTGFFPGTVSSWYWTSTTAAAPGVNYAWGVIFNLGRPNFDLKTSSHYVRCVSSGP